VPFVVDASITLAWYFVDEKTAFTDAVLKRLPSEGALAPTIWPMEVANILILGERRQRITSAQSIHIVQELTLLPIEVDQAPVSLVFSTTLGLAQSLGITVYDASYLELAMRRGVALATIDRQLASAAATMGVPLIT